MCVGVCECVCGEEGGAGCTLGFPERSRHRTFEVEISAEAFSLGWFQSLNKRGRRWGGEGGSGRVILLSVGSGVSFQCPSSVSPVLIWERYPALAHRQKGSLIKI